MTTACTIIHSLAGSPAFDGATEVSGRCWVCASEMARGIVVKKWQGSSFTDQNKARNPDGSHVCEACAWAMSWVQPPGHPPAAPGKKGLNLRLFSHLHDARGYWYGNKKNKAEIRAWLRGDKRGPWFAAIADSGQKHVLPWTPINPDGAAGGVVRFEERNVRLPRTDDGWIMVDAVTDLLSYGVTKEEVERGEYSVRTYQNVPRNVLQAFESQHGRHRGGGWFALVVWLSQRDEVTYENRRKQGRGATGGDGKRDPGTARGVPGKRREPAQALEPTAGPRANGSEDERKRAGLDYDDVPKPPADGDGQLTLF